MNESIFNFTQNLSNLNYEITKNIDLQDTIKNICKSWDNYIYGSYGVFVRMLFLYMILHHIKRFIKIKIPIMKYDIEIFNKNFIININDKELDLISEIQLLIIFFICMRIVTIFINQFIYLDKHGFIDIIKYLIFGG